MVAKNPSVNSCEILKYVNKEIKISISKVAMLIIVSERENGKLFLNRLILSKRITSIIWNELDNIENTAYENKYLNTLYDIAVIKKLQTAWRQKLKQYEKDANKKESLGFCVIWDI